MAKGGAKKAAAALAAANRMLADNRQARHRDEILETLEAGKLLAHRREIDKLRGLVDKKGLTLIPFNINFNRLWIKLTIDLDKGRKIHNNQASEKGKQFQRDMKSTLKSFNKF